MDSQLQRERLLGTDPLEGNESIAFFAAKGVESLQAFLPVAGQPPRIDWQAEHRLAKLCGRIGPPAAEYLLQVIVQAPWHTKVLAAACYRDLPNLPALRDPLAGLLEKSSFDVERNAIDALGYLGADQWAFKIKDVTLASSSATEKLHHNALQALTRMVAREQDDHAVFYDLVALENFIAAFREGRVATTRGHWPGSVEGVLNELTPTAADTLMQRWLGHEDALFRDLAAQALGHIGLKRAVPRLAARLLDPAEDDAVRYAAAIALGKAEGAAGCQSVQEALERSMVDDASTSSASGSRRPSSSVGRGVLWAFSALFPYCADGAKASALIQAVLDAGTEPRGQLLYGLGIRKCVRYADVIVADLHAEASYHRGAAALGLVRLRGADARAPLLDLEREVSNPTERAFVLAALVHARAEEKADALHQALGAFDSSLLRRPWKREVLAALVRGKDGRARAEAWAALMHVDLDVCLRELHALVGDEADPVPAVPPLEEASSSAAASALVATAPDAAEAATAHNQVFISYSHQDERWLNLLMDTLKPVLRKHPLAVWSDHDIKPGEQWRNKIEEALAAASVAVLLVSRPFLASDFIHKNELPPLLKAAEEKGVTILWVAIGHSLYKETEIADFQAVNDPSKPLNKLRGARRDEVLVDIAYEIVQVAGLT